MSRLLLIVVCRSINEVADAGVLEDVRKEAPNLSDKPGQFNEGIRTLGAIRDFLLGRAKTAWALPVILFHPQEEIEALREEIAACRRADDVETLYVSPDAEDLSDLRAKVAEAVSQLSPVEETVAASA